MKRELTCVALALTLAMMNSAATASEHDHDDEHEHQEKGAHEDEHGHGHEESPSKFRAGKAIEAVKSDGKLFKLSEQSLKTLNVTWAAVEQVKPNVFKIPRPALVHFQDETGVYVKRDEWFAMVPVKVSATSATHATVTSASLRQGDQIVITGTPFLRIAHLEAMGQGGQGHVH